MMISPPSEGRGEHNFEILFRVLECATASETLFFTDNRRRLTLHERMILHVNKIKTVHTQKKIETL